MTVERLIELLEREYPQALVAVTLQSCAVGAGPYYRPSVREGEPEAVSHSSRKGRVYIQAQGHDC